MKLAILLLITKIISFIGAILNTVGFLTFFFWEALKPYRWQMIVGGLILIIIAELIGRFIIKKITDDTEINDYNK